MLNRLAAGSVAFLMLAGARTLPAADAPQWLQQAARSELPAFDATVPAVVLYECGRVVVDESGRRTLSLAFAVKVLSREGRDTAVARAAYAPDWAKVRELNAWIVRPSGDATRL